MESAHHHQGGWFTPSLLAVLFLAALTPFASDHLLFHPDERHYVDGGLQMVQSGDWLTPRDAEGNPRLHKPVVSYWFSAVGITLFGQNPFATRIFFVLSGAGLVVMTYLSGRLIGDSHRTGVMAALIAMCHPAVLISSMRSMPDIVLGFFLSVSLYGFLRILKTRQIDLVSLACAYGAGALAILTKGAPAVLFVGLGTFYLVWRDPRLVALHGRQLLLAVLSCLFLSSSWFLAMWLLHGSLFSDQFFQDQGGQERMASDLGQIIIQGIGYLSLTAVSFTWILLPSMRSIWNRLYDLFPRKGDPVLQFVMAWTLSYLAAAACINHVSLRYLVPVIPGLALLLSRLIQTVECPLLRVGFRRFSWVTCLTLPVLAMLVWASLLRHEPWRAALLLTLIALTGAWIWRQMRLPGLLRSMSVTAVVVLSTLFVSGQTLQGLLGRSFGENMAAVLHQTDGASELIIVGPLAHATRVRLFSDPSVTIRHHQPKDKLPSREDALIAVLETGTQSAVQDLAPIAKVECGFHRMSLSEIWEAIGSAKLVPFLVQKQRSYVVVSSLAYHQEQAGLEDHTDVTSASAQWTSTQVR